MANKVKIYSDLKSGKVQFDGSSDFKNQGWKYNENTSEWIAIGNMGFKFSEIV